MGLRVWVVEEQTHAHVPVGFPFEPVNKPMGTEINSNSYPNREKPTVFRVAGSHCHLYLNCNACPARPLLPPIAWGSGVRTDGRMRRAEPAALSGSEPMRFMPSWGEGDSPCMWSHGPLDARIRGHFPGRCTLAVFGSGDSLVIPEVPPVSV
jgi:hypothetical protein